MKDIKHDYTGYYTADELALRRQQERNNQRESDLREIQRLKLNLSNEYGKMQNS